ncbi:BcsR/BcsP family cellulose biosynthesis protein [Pistricoccus aurantiacus]|uniref:BcsR/BcsP family cellulose biosynthesis protein n=1 Tax=Pistricoccus aurantiacus TaxID=1883414 RepID=UPI003632634D
MQTDANISSFQQLSLNNNDEDISLLLDKSNLKTLNYYNITQIERLAPIRARWPLLSELILTKEKAVP